MSKHPFKRYLLNHLGIQAPMVQPLAATRSSETSNHVLAGSKTDSCLEALRHRVHQCIQCSLHQTKTHYVFGEGSPNAEIMFIGEGPGRDEDLSGRPFVGRAGQLLTRVIVAMKLRREDVYIANVVKCRPPQNRVPLPDEAAMCFPYLEQQIELIGPKVLVLLGATAATYLLKRKVAISKARGSWTTITTQSNKTFDVMPTFHPAALLRNPNLKKDLWNDMKHVLSRIGKPL